MFADSIIRYRKSEPGTLTNIFRGKKWLKQSFSGILVHSGSIVANFNIDKVALMFCSDAQNPAFSICMLFLDRIYSV